MVPRCHGEVPESSLHPQQGSAMVNGQSDLGCLDQLTPKVYGGQETSRLKKVGLTKDHKTKSSS